MNQSGKNHSCEADYSAIPELVSEADSVPVSCPIVLFIEPVPSICLNSDLMEIELTVAIEGENGTGFGVWSGPGIVDPITGIFAPNAPDVLIGSNIISYTYTENDCIIVESTIINVNEPPVVDAGSNYQLSCTDTLVTLTGFVLGNNLVMNWSGPGIVEGENTLNPKVNLPGWYFLSVSNPATSCSNTDSVHVSINVNVPLAFAGPDKTISCVDTLAMLQGSGSVGPDFQFVWQGPDIHAANKHLQFPEVGIPGKYVLKVRRIANNCFSLADTVIVFDQTQSPSVAITQPIDTINCKVINFNLVALEQEHSVYEWFDLSATPTSLGDERSIFIENPGIYAYVVKDTLTGCMNSDTIAVHDNDEYPSIGIRTPDVLDCNILEITLDGSASISGANIEYTWEGPNGGISGDPNAAITTAVLPGVYIFSVLDTQYGCKSDTTIHVQQEDNGPEASVSVPVALDCKTTETILDGTPSTSINGHAFQWSFGQDMISDQALTSVNQAGAYQLIIRDTLNNCLDTTIVQVVYEDNAVTGTAFEIVPNICFGEQNAEVKVLSVTGGSEPYLYSLDGGIHFVSTPHFGNLKAGEYSLTIKDAYGCTMDTAIVIPDPPKIEFSLGDNFTLKLSERDTIEALFNIEFENIQQLVWAPENQIECVNPDTCLSIAIHPMNDLSVSATLIDQNGCVAYDEILVSVSRDELVYVPNIFSPNNDGKNDLFMIYGGPEIGLVNQFYVYNRSGETVYEGAKFRPNDPRYGWDGTLKGKNLNPAVFVYWAEIELIDGQRVIYKGDVTLVR